MRVDVLTRLDAKTVPQDDREIRLFCKLRNELVRLQYFLDYYRKMGIDRFIFIDNGSTDGTTDYLLAQHDCHVLYTTDPFRDVYVYWQNRALDLYGSGHWCLVVDADEFLVYPHCEKMGLKTFCAFLDQQGSEGVYSFMLDMYAQGDLSQAVYKSGQSPLEVCPYHDRDYKFVRRTFMDTLKLPRRPPSFPETEVIGGPRTRLFYPSQNTDKVLPRVLPRMMGILLKPLVKCGLFSKDKLPHMSPMLFKVPLVKWRAGLRYYASTHIITPIKLSKVSSALLHFKYFSDFQDKAVSEAARGAYHGGGNQYGRYKQGLENKKNNEGLFYYEGSVKYESSDRLAELGLLKNNAG